MQPASQEYCTYFSGMRLPDQLAPAGALLCSSFTMFLPTQALEEHSAAKSHSSPSHWKAFREQLWHTPGTVPSAAALQLSKRCSLWESLLGACTYHGENFSLLSCLWDSTFQNICMQWLVRSWDLSCTEMSPTEQCSTLGLVTFSYQQLGDIQGMQWEHDSAGTLPGT